MAKPKLDKTAIGRAKPPPSLGLTQPFKHWNEKPPLALPLQRYVGHAWLTNDKRIAEYLAGEITEPDVSWYFQVVEENDLGMAMKRKYKAWTSAEEQVVFLRYNYFRRQAICAALRHSRCKDKRDKSKALHEIKYWEDKALTVRAIIAAKNLGLVLSMCSRQIKGFGDYDDDLIGEGNAALLRAVDLFDFSYLFKFSTYACRAVIKSIIRYRQKKQKIRNMEGASYTDEEHTGWAPSYVDKRLCHDEESYRMEKMIIALRENTANLSKVERDILLHRFGFMNDDGKQVTLVNVGKTLGLTKERVRQIQNAALEKMAAVLKESV